MPEVTPILDSFTRADSTTTLGANWSLLTDFAVGGTNLGISGNAAYKGSGVAYVVMYWNVATFGPDCEVYLTISTLSASDNLTLYARAKEPGNATYDGYALNIDLSTTPDTWVISKIVNGTSTPISSSITQNVVSGEKILLECRGSTMKAYHFTGGSWVEKLSIVDTTHVGAGNIGFYGGGNSSTWRYDDFGGGTLPQPMALRHTLDLAGARRWGRGF